MYTRNMMALVATLALAVGAQAALTVTDIDADTITWTNDVPTGYFRVEWSADLTATNGGWQASWSNLWSFGAGASNTVPFQAPRYFRVQWATNAWPDESERAIDSEETDYAVSLSGASFPNLAADSLYAIDWRSGTNWSRSWASGANIAATGTVGHARIPTTLRVRVLSSNTPPAVAGMSWVFHGTYAFGPPGSNHNVAVNGIYADRTEVTQGLWRDVTAWAITNGYSLADPIALTGDLGPEFPVSRVSWSEAVAWCNARSERDGLTPIYYADAACTNVLRDTEQAVFARSFTNNGYRLPTEAEWERAARGFIAGAHFPWGGDTDAGDAARANTWLSGDLSEHLWFLVTPAGGHAELQAEYVGVLPAAPGEADPSPWQTYLIVYPPNGWGLVDMAGNVGEWCWDWWRPDAPQGTNNPTGPATGTHRMVRGGSFGNTPDKCTVFHRGFQRPDARRACTGFRCVRSR